MINYLRFAIKISPFDDYLSDILAYELGTIAFESFDLQGEELSAFVQEPLFDVASFAAVTDSFKETYHVDLAIEQEIIVQKNWNEEWEKHYFNPILIGNECLIRSSFHTDLPTATYEIQIDPKMSFGTGHHETTSMMVEWVLEEPMQGKSVLDMGCGTAVLAILASMRGAIKVWAVDIDEWCFANAQENIALNNVNDIKILQGGSEVIENEHFDTIIANINLNILLENMPYYVKALNNNGVLVMSGFYLSDLPALNNMATQLGLSQIAYKEKNNWVSVKYCL